MDGAVREVRIPGGVVIDGAVAELAVAADGTITADIRIPGPPAR